MDREEIVKKIREIRQEVERDELNHLRAKIMDRKFHLHGSHRNPIVRLIPLTIRKRLILEISLILQPILDNQREINLRFLKEIKRLREVLASLPGGPSEDKKTTHGPAE